MIDIGHDDYGDDDNMMLIESLIMAIMVMMVMTMIKIDGHHDSSIVFFS